MTENKSPDVVIVGAGMVGAATAYYLAKAGAKVTILDKDPIGVHASGLALGGLGPLSGAGIPDPIGGLCMESWRLHLELSQALPEELGYDYEFQTGTSVAVAFNAEEARILKERLSWQASQDGFKVEWREKADILAIEPRLIPVLLGGVVTEPSAMLNTYEFNNALVAGALRYGAALKMEKVTGLRFDGGRVSGVSLQDGGAVHCDKVVIAMGPWSNDASAWLDFTLPISPLKGQILRLRSEGPPIPHINWNGSYAVSKPDGLVWVGTTEEKAGFDDTPSAAGRQTILRSVASVLPHLTQADVVKQTACLRPVSPDGLPVLGRIPAKPGVIVASGAGRKGILMGPAMGKAAADLVLNGTSTLDVSALSPGRF